MAETLTESFCERCGTRYEFKAPTRLNPLRKTRGFVGGLRNYLTSQDALSDAIGDAMRSEENGLATAQLDAFHESFNFCIDCRQYTCVNCWNDDAGRCRSCAPIPGTDDLAERLAASMAPAAAVAAPQVFVGDELQRRLGLDAWPTSDLPVGEGSNGHGPHDWPDAEFAPEREPMVTEVEPEPVVAVFEPVFEPEPVVAEAEPEPEPAVADVATEPEPVVAEFEHEPEPVAAEVEHEPEPEPTVAEVEPWLVAADITPEPVFGAPEPVVTEIEIEPVRLPLQVVAWDEDAPFELFEPVVAEVEPEPSSEPPARLAPISETILHFPARRTAAEVDDERATATAADGPEVAARRAQLDLLGLDDPGDGPVAPERPQPLPYRSRGAAVTQAELARAAALRGSFWEASAREVAEGAGGQVGVQSCGQCGLSLSANARFCRRCGTRQAQSA